MKSKEILKKVNKQIKNIFEFNKKEKRHNKILLGQPENFLN